MTQTPRAGRRWSRGPAARLVLVGCLAAVALAACTRAGATSASPASRPAASEAAAAGASQTFPVTSAAPATPSGPTLGPLADQFHADVLVRQPGMLDVSALDKLGRLAAGRMVGMRLATVSLQPGPAGSSPGAAATPATASAAPTAGNVRVAAVDPARFRSYTPAVTSQVTAVWDAVAAGDVMVSYDVSQKLHLVLGGTVVLQVGTNPPLPVRLGALADTAVPDVDAVISDDLANRLGIDPGTNGLLLAGNGQNAGSLSSAVRDALPAATEVYLLTDHAVTNQRAFLSSAEMAKAFGTLPYQELPGGVVVPDPAWVQANIVRAQVPIIGSVTCHRLMIGPLSGALAEIQREGLADRIHPDQYEGCYVPKLIEDSDAVSLHTWGIAVDLNVPTNERGTRGDMDPEVVAIFKRWGFRWGGDYTTVPDPMHFELVALPRQ